MFWKKAKLKRKRESDYLILNQKFQDKHNIISKYYIKTHLTGLQPTTPEGFEFQVRLKSFFGDKYGELPKSYKAFANVSYGDPDFDHYPLEKLQSLYDQIEIIFPEVFYNSNNYCTFTEN